MPVGGGGCFHFLSSCLESSSATHVVLSGEDDDGCARASSGNLNLHTHYMQLPDLLPQEPGLHLYAGYFVPHPAEHYHDSDLR